MMNEHLVENRAQRIAVIGSTGSGKTTVARRLAAAMKVPHVELDSLYWGPGWTPAQRDVFRERVQAALAREAWVVDGNYSAVRDLVWRRADTIIWLDPSLPVIYGRLARRTARRIARREPLWNGNRERVLDLFASDNLFLWAWQYHRRKRPAIPGEFARPEYSHLTVYRLRSPQEVKRWLAAFKQA